MKFSTYIAVWLVLLILAALFVISQMHVVAPVTGGHLVVASIFWLAAALAATFDCFYTFRGREARPDKQEENPILRPLVHAGAEGLCYLLIWGLHFFFAILSFISMLSVTNGRLNFQVWVGFLLLKILANLWMAAKWREVA